MEVLAGIVFVAFVVFAIFRLARARMPRRARQLFALAMGLHVIGAFFYYYLVESVYGGGDYGGYFARGLDYADRLRKLDFSMFTNSDEWIGGRWWGTQFVTFPAGIVTAFTGANLLAISVVFSVLAFVGLIAIAIAFQRSFPTVPLRRYAVWIWLFPSLWFWPATLGKDALVLLGLGATILGFVGMKRRLRWPLMATGMFIVFGVRPQVAAVVALSMLMGYWVERVSGWARKNSFQGIGLALAGLWLIQTAMGNVAGGSNLDTVYDYVEIRAQSAAIGGTNTGDIAPGWQGIPSGIINILLRPFPWEGRSSTAFFASLETYALWAIAIRKRGNIVRAFRNWRSNRLLSFAFLFTILYTVALGMQVVNLGIIARQRIFIFPFLFLMFEAVPKLAAASSTSSTTFRRVRHFVPVNARSHGLNT